MMGNWDVRFVAGVLADFAKLMAAATVVILLVTVAGAFMGAL